MADSTSIPIIVQGNTFSLAIPLQIYQVSGGSMVLQDYTPDPTDQVSIQLKGSRRQYTYTPSITDNIAYIDLSGNEMADNYGIVVSIVKEDGQRLRSFRTDQFFIVESSDDLTPEDIIEGLENNVIYLNTQAFVAGEKGSEGEAGATISSVEKTATVGKVDTYTIEMTDGSSFTFDVTNGLDGVDLGAANIVDDLTTGGATNVLSAEQGKIIGNVLFDQTATPLTGTDTAASKINNSGVIVSGNVGYGSITTIDVTSITSTIRIHGNCTGYSKSAFAFYNASNTLLQKGNSFSGDGNIDVDATVTKPSGATKLVLSQNSGGTSMYAEMLVETDKVEKLVEDVDSLQVTFTTTGRRLYGYDVVRNAKIDASGAIVSGEQSYGFITKIVIPSGVSKVRIYGNAGVYNKTIFAFYQGSTLVEKGDSYAGAFDVDVDKVVDVPNTADTIALCQNSSSYGTLYADWVEDTTQAEDVGENLNDISNINSLNSAELMSLHYASQARAEGRMIFEDDFQGNKLNESIWGVDEGQFLNRNWYVNAKENVWVENSILHISATKTNRYGKVAAGQITTRGKFDFCGNVRIEGKFKMPTITAFWPAFWTWGTDTYAVSRGGGAYTELDIFELFGSNQRIYCNLWTGDAVGDGSTTGLTDEQLVMFNNDNEWHIYTADIYQDCVIISIDGTPFIKYALSTTKRQYVYTMRQYVLISLQILGNETATNAIDGATLECDWIRVYSLDNSDMMPSAFSIPSTLSMSVGDKVRLIPTFTDGIMRTTTYDIVDENIVGHGDLVNSELVAKAAGTTDIYVITKNRKSAKCTITVS